MFAGIALNRTLTARSSATDKVVILTAITHQYQEALESFACNLKIVGGYDSLVVAALDHSTYVWGRRKKYPVVYSPKYANSWSLKSTDITYGTSVYKSTTKFKSRLVLDVLRRGYSVIFTDPDVAWFANPIEAISPFWISDIVIQSESQLIHYPLQALNSGLYAVKSKEVTIHAFEQIVQSARNSDTSEQPHFRKNLCQLEKTEGECIYTYTHTRRFDFMFKRRKRILRCQVTTLPLHSFPNGGVKFANKSFFEHGPEEFQLIVDAPLYAVHDNWIEGLENKKKRQVEWGLWWDASSCLARGGGGNVVQ